MPVGLKGPQSERHEAQSIEFSGLANKAWFAVAATTTTTSPTTTTTTCRPNPESWKKIDDGLKRNVDAGKKHSRWSFHEILTMVEKSNPGPEFKRQVRWKKFFVRKSRCCGDFWALFGSFRCSSRLSQVEKVRASVSFKTVKWLLHCVSGKSPLRGIQVF